MRPHLSQLVDRLVEVAGGEDTACMSLLSLAVAKAEADIVPFAGKLGAALIARCGEELDSGVDVTETPTLESLVNIVNVRCLALCTVARYTLLLTVAPHGTPGAARGTRGG